MAHVSAAANELRNGDVPRASTEVAIKPETKSKAAVKRQVLTCGNVGASEKDEVM